MIDNHNSYFLRLFDYNLLAFSLHYNGLDGLNAHILWISSSLSHLLPPDLTLSDNGLVSWLKRRVIQKNRAFVHNILLSMGLTSSNTKGILDVCLGLSLNDCYWVVPSNFIGSFKDYNLYQNPFSKTLSLIAYTGRGSTHNPLSTSPIFDNGVSLFNYAMKDDIDNLEDYAKTRTNPYDVPYETICSEVMGNNQRQQLKRLIRFRFHRHTSYNLPEKRLKAIEWQIDRRIKQLLNLPKS